MSRRVFKQPDIISNIVQESLVVTPLWEQWFLDLTNIQTEWSIIEAVINPVSVAANTTAAQVITITQVIDNAGSTKTITTDDLLFEVGDHIVKIIKPTLTAGLFINQGRVTDKNEITIEFGNVTASAIDAASETYTIIVLKG